MPHTSIKKTKHITAEQLLNDEVANSLNAWTIPIKMRNGKEGKATIVRSKSRSGYYSVAFHFPTTSLKIVSSSSIERIVEMVNEYIDIASNHDVMYMKRFLDTQN